MGAGLGSSGGSDGEMISLRERFQVPERGEVLAELVALLLAVVSGVLRCVG